MAYVSQERKKHLVANLKKVIPADWKWTTSVRNSSTISLNIWSAPVDLIAEHVRVHDTRHPLEKYTAKPSYLDVNTYWLGHSFDEHLELFEQIKDALNDGNHDRSDSYTDYFDVGWYIDINLGKWDKPFKVQS